MPPLVTPLKVGGPRSAIDALGGGMHGYEALASIANRSITINGETQAPAFMYLGKSGADPWPAVVGAGLAKVENGADITYGVAIGTKNALDKGITYAAGDFHRSAGATEGDIALDDHVIECGFTIGSVEKWFLSKMDAGYHGWSLVAGGTFRVYYNLRSGGTSVTVQHNTGTYVVGSRHLAHIVCNRSGLVRLYVDGTSKATADATPMVATSATNASGLSIGGNSTGSQYYDGGVHYAAQWKFTDIGTDDQAAWVASRWALFGGFV